MGHVDPGTDPFPTAIATALLTIGCWQTRWNDGWNDGGAGGELAGNAAGELYAFFGHDDPKTLDRVDKVTGALDQLVTLDMLSGVAVHQLRLPGGGRGIVDLRAARHPSRGRLAPGATKRLIRVLLALYN